VVAAHELASERPQAVCKRKDINGPDLAAGLSGKRAPPDDV